MFHNKQGRFKHNDIIGQPFGCQWTSEASKTVDVLRPTPELWTRVLPHRTQILYHPDISLISEMLELRPGSVVVESGTGSGSFSHSIARAIGPAGRLHTFEFHPVRAEKAREEFEEHGLTGQITVYHRDVCKNGFGLNQVADAVFLDLPAPWEALPHAKRALRVDRPTRVCCFSPCAEQVQKTFAALRALGFCEVTMYETLLREHVVSEITMRTVDGEERVVPVTRPAEPMRGHTSYLTFATLLPVFQ